jgi:hypothetical protein
VIARAQVSSTKKAPIPKRLQPRRVNPKQNRPTPYEWKDTGDLRIENLKFRIHFLEQQRLMDLQEYSPNSNQVRSINRELTALRQQLSKLRPRGRDWWVDLRLRT